MKSILLTIVASFLSASLASAANSIEVIRCLSADESRNKAEIQSSGQINVDGEFERSIILAHATHDIWPSTNSSTGERLFQPEFEQKVTLEEFIAGKPAVVFNYKAHKSYETIKHTLQLAEDGSIQLPMKYGEEKEAYICSKTPIKIYRGDNNGY